MAVVDSRLKLNLKIGSAVHNLPIYEDYSEFYNEKDHTLNINNIINLNLRIDRVLNSQLAAKYGLDCGEIRPMLEWLEQK